MARLAFQEITSQRDALEAMARLIREGSVDPRIVQAARALTRDCEARDDLCELESIFRAVKYGDGRVPWLRKGMRYVADSYSFDTFNSVNATIEQCSSGACAGDCDDQTILVAALCAALGFKVGARAWGKGASQGGEYQHVYPVACVPKAGPWPSDYYGTALDTTVPQSEVGWEPDGGHIMTAWIE